VGETGFCFTCLSVKHQGGLTWIVVICNLYTQEIHCFLNLQQYTVTSSSFIFLFYLTSIIVDTFSVTMMQICFFVLKTNETVCDNEDSLLFQKYILCFK